jgi:hypothetical protein
MRLPEFLRPCFWDHAFGRLRWERDRDFIVGRVLAHGSWQAVQWVREQLDDAALRAWLRERRGRGLSPRQLRYWQLALGLPRREVTAWLAAPERQIWDRRRHE